MAAETKKCPDCEQVIGESETQCPKCGCDLEVINDETISHFQRLSKIAEQRKPKPPVTEAVPKRNRSLFRNLGRKG